MAHHNHSHSHHHYVSDNAGRLLITILLNFIITIAEIIGGILSGSLSLLSDALHNFSDGISVLVSYIALRLAHRPQSLSKTFGYKRAEVLAALFNAAILMAISLYLFMEAYERFIKPAPIKGGLMILVASIGLLANTISVFLLHRGSKTSLNIRSAYFHLLSDAFSSLAVIGGGIAILFWNIYWIDPILTILINLYILKESYHIVKEAINIVMQSTPAHIDINEIVQETKKIHGVHNIHHIHLWMLTENEIHLEAHIEISGDPPLSEATQIRHCVATMLEKMYHIHHCTLQIETSHLTNHPPVEDNCMSC